jgi:hypothetical protein
MHAVRERNINHIDLRVCQQRFITGEESWLATATSWLFFDE